MRLRLAAISGLLVSLVLAAHAETDLIMGNWEGKWETDEGASGDLAVKIVALGGSKYDMVMSTVVDGTDRTFKTGIAAAPAGDKTKLTGKLDLGPDFGETKIDLTLDKDTIEGTSEGDQVKTRVNLKRVSKKSPTLGMAPPPGAIVLFDGKDLSGWKLRNGDPAPWKVEDGAMTVAYKREGAKVLKGDIIAPKPHGDARIHIEFRTPFMPRMRGQARGNSGVYVQGLYEVQVLDSFGLPAKIDEAGGIYKAAVPKVNASLPPGEWQTYDITYRAPKFDESGKLTTPGDISVVYNGVPIHENVKITEPTPGNAGNDPKKPGAILLQDHGNPVSFRNIWFEPLTN